MARIRIWDLPTRLFHWALVLAVVAAFASEKAGNMDAHGIAGLTVLGLIVFRLVWGVAGGSYSRFSEFVRGPQAIRDYLQGRWHGQGHNPLGALSVLAMLFILLLQAVMGLFANDDSTFYGPLADLVSRDTSDLVSRLHRLQELVIIGLVLLHVAAIVFYARVKKDNLVKPMITGFKDVEPGAKPGTQGGGIAFIVAVLIALGTVYVASGALIPPAPVVEVEAPSW